MSKYSVLDCTLRDGGYINDFNFGYSTIKDIILKLNNSKVDIVECGFLKSNFYDKDRTLFGSVEFIKEFIEPKNENTLYVAMIAYGDISDEEISPYDGTSIDGIRLTFHKSQINEAVSLGKKLIAKGYKVFMQPVGTTSYDKQDLIELINKVNAINPFAFYLVDTLGTMYKDDLIEMFDIADKHLKQGIKVGFHSHNNLQLSYSNAIEILAHNTEREIIIDSTVFGMGRGAGNLCTELITQYINKNIENKYDVVPILEIYDEHINRILLKYKWGYSLPYFIASTNECHPNYATHLINKQTITIKEINRILSLIDENKRDIFDKEYIEKLYIEYQKHNIDDKETLEKIREEIINRDIVILAPGSSINKEKQLIKEHCENNNSLVIAVNFMPDTQQIDYLFLSNQKRIKKLSKIKENSLKKGIIITSNLMTGKVKGYKVINYADYLNEEPIISDNAGLMLLNLLSKLKVRKVSLAGFDGFSIHRLENYYDSEYTNSTEFETLEEKTVAIKNKIKEISNKMEINFITKSRYT